MNVQQPSEREEAGNAAPCLEIAVFGDIHGRVALMYTLAHLWEERAGRSLFALLQVGDMGAFPDHNKLDRATRAHAKRDLDELDFVTFSAPSADGARYLGRSEAPTTYFIRGNHEDFEYLRGFKNVSAVDPWGRLRYLEDGAHISLSYGPDTELLSADMCADLGIAQGSLTVGGFGGVAPPVVPRARGRRAREAHRKAERKSRAGGMDKYFALGSISKVFAGAPQLDILMTHAGPACDAFPQGSEPLAELSKRLAPAWHFFGHHHVVLGPVEGPGGGRLVALEHLDFDRAGRLQDDAWGILRWPLDGSPASFQFANVQTMPWLRDVWRHTYRGYL